MSGPDFAGAQQDMVQEISMEISLKDGMNGAERRLKRCADALLALVSLLLLSPVLIFISLMIYRRKEGPVLYRQERIGFGGKPFRILKFRTMPVDYEGDGVPQLEGKREVSLAPIYRFLRDHHLDELPQLWNVLVGDMSFVGPRPERKYFIEQIMEQNPDYEYLYLMRPGITSWATIYNGYTDTMEKMLVRLQMDLDYLQKRSLWVDIKIIFTTANYIINGKKI